MFTKDQSIGSRLESTESANLTFTKVEGTENEYTAEYAVKDETEKSLTNHYDLRFTDVDEAYNARAKAATLSEYQILCMKTASIKATTQSQKTGLKVKWTLSSEVKMDSYEIYRSAES